MVVSSLYIMDLKGKVIISRNYRGDVPASAADKFAQRVLERDETELKPIWLEEGVTYIFVKHNNLYLMAMTNQNSNAAMVLLYLQRFAEVGIAAPVGAGARLTRAAQVCKGYFGELEEESIRDNFVILYELFDEMMDHGYPQVTEDSVLKRYIMQQSNKLRKKKKKSPDAQLPATATHAVSWRPPGIKHKKNEIFLDVVEKLNLLVSSTGRVLSSEILGAVKMRSFLSGMPELKLGLNDKVLFESTGRRAAARGRAVEMEDIKFHQCVRLARFENDRTISFIPPDGEFELMTYRLNTHVKPLIWVEAAVVPYSHSRIEYMIKTKSQFKARSIANNVEIVIPVPPDVDSPSFKASIGTVTYVPDRDAVVWKIKQFYGAREYLMRAHFGLPSVDREGSDDTWKRPIGVNFEIPYFTVSGIQVRYLKIIEKSGYQALPWVRYITQNGDYQLRMAEPAADQA